MSLSLAMHLGYHEVSYPDQSEVPTLHCFFQMSRLCRYSAFAHAASSAICRSTTSRAIFLAISKATFFGNDAAHRLAF